MPLLACISNCFLNPLWNVNHPLSCTCSSLNRIWLNCFRTPKIIANDDLWIINHNFGNLLMLAYFFNWTYCMHILSNVSFLKVSKWSQKSFLRISENYTFESVILESIKIKSVVVDAHCLCHVRRMFFHFCSLFTSNIFQKPVVAPHCTFVHF